MTQTSTKPTPLTVFWIDHEGVDVETRCFSEYHAQQVESGLDAEGLHHSRKSPEQDLLETLASLAKIFEEVSETYRGKCWTYGATELFSAKAAIARRIKAEG